MTSPLEAKLYDVACNLIHSGERDDGMPCHPEDDGQPTMYALVTVEADSPEEAMKIAAEMDTSDMGFAYVTRFDPFSAELFDGETK